MCDSMNRTYKQFKKIMKNDMLQLDIHHDNEGE